MLTVYNTFIELYANANSKIKYPKRWLKLTF